MLQIVALPVALMESAPGPKYSMIAPVPPLTVRTFATSRITSFGRGPARQSDPVRCTPMSLGQRRLNGEPGHDVDGVAAADADGDHAEAAGVGRVAVGADHHAARKGVVLEHDLMDDARAGLPESDAELGAHAAQEVVDLGVGVQRGPKVDGGVGLRAGMRWSQCTVVGTTTSSRPAVMNCSATIWASASCRATRSGSRST